MVSEKECASIRRFVCGQLRDEPDLSTLTIRILRKQYLALVGHESLSPGGKNYMKQVVEEELMKMQDNVESAGELEIKKPQKKRKRQKEDNGVISGQEDEDESRAKKICHQLSPSLAESEPKGSSKKGSKDSEEEDQMKSGSEDAEQEMEQSRPKKNGIRKQQISSEDSTDEEISESENESNCSDSGREMVKEKVNTTKNGETGSSSPMPGKKIPESDEESETEIGTKSEKSDKINGQESSDDTEKEENVSAEKENNDPDSDSSSLPSLEDDQNTATENKQDSNKKTTMKKEEKKNSKVPKNDNKAVTRLKRYISLCGVKRNFKKLLGGCRSVRAMVAVLKKELEDLGVQGNPSIKKCKQVKKKREEAQELAELDVSNIIASQGRPKRRGASARQEQHAPPSSTYQRTLNSGSDSDQENNTQAGRRRATDWANLQGIISDDADSD